jgi:hypothetical protein
MIVHLTIAIDSEKDSSIKGMTIDEMRSYFENENAKDEHTSNLIKIIEVKEAPQSI